MALLASDIQVQMSVSCGVESTQTTLYAQLLYSIQHALDALYAEEWTWNQVIDQFTTTAPYETGTVSGSLASTTVTGNGTSWGTTWVDTYMDLNNKMHKVASYGTGGTSATLEAALDAAVAASTSYAIYYPWVTLNATLRSVTRVQPYPYDPLVMRTVAELSDLFQTHQTQSWASDFAMVTDDASKYTRIALYPFPTEGRMYDYTGFRSAPTLSASTETLIPDDYRHLLTEMALAHWWVSGDHNEQRANRCEQKSEQLKSPLKKRDGIQIHGGPRQMPSNRLQPVGPFPRPFSVYELPG